MYPITMSGRVVRLREFRAGDAADSLSVLGDDEVTRWLSFDSRSPAEAQSLIEGAIHRAQLDPRTEYYMAVTLPDDRLIGFVRLGLDGVQAAKLGYAIRADKWGHGYATDAARTITEFGFRQLNLHRISAAIGPENEASIAVVRQLGMQYEGRIRHHVFTNGSWRDSLLYSVLAEEWDSAIPIESAHLR
ncbi:N-acetyltransferase GCN5 [Virgisporangium aliadipatigenens]|uniref:N-acetyltransferase GCN5 n=1 Tax=Virgisporangium aliadipatigenens TaxID=741659 RepID=A0A8J3YIF2_9ACTN|nr:GNAT family protein [Virgisporangium aliadipatigenens]GIJ44526.1 N-acetyltransferase GCN5 [Virgisporangium aliadipatigenens]